MSGSREYNGDPIDASWSTAPWNRDGETIEASDDNTEEHTMATIEWPEGATPKENLNENQRVVIKKAARYRDMDSSRKLTDLAAAEMSDSYAASVLASHWPERYWVDPEESTDDTYLGALEKHKPKTDETKCSAGEKNPRSRLTKEDVKEARIRAKNGESASGIAGSFDVANSTIRKAITGYNWAGVDSPQPLEYNTEKGEYVPKSQNEDKGVNGDGGSEQKSVHDAELVGFNDDKDADTEDAEQQEQTTYHSPTPTEPDTPGAWAYVAVAAVVYGCYRLIRRLF